MPRASEPPATTPNEPSEHIHSVKAINAINQDVPPPVLPTVVDLELIDPALRGHETAETPDLDPPANFFPPLATPTPIVEVQEPAAGELGSALLCLPPAKPT